MLNHPLKLGKSPVLKWVIRGDVDNNHITDPYGDFGRLGQTWSEPKLARVKWNGGERQVLLFGGGYDVAVDNQSTIQNNNIGNAVFMVDAETGSLLWRASNNGSNLNMSDMRYSIPAGLAVVDVDQDGFTDYFYAVDMGGQIIRFDVNQTNSGSSNFARGGVIARISGTSSGDARRFFETPDVSISSTFDYLNIAIGTGLRHSPLNTAVNDRMYVIRDPHIFEPPADYTYVGNSVITESSLYDATTNLIQQGSTTQKEAALNSLNNSNGWYIRLEESGEKILSRPKVFSGLLLFNSFALNTTNVNECLPNPGVNYFYAVNVENAGSVFNFENLGSTGPLDKSHRKKLLKHSTLAPEPSIMSRGNQGSEICVGTECFQDTLRSVGSIPVERSFWRENR